VQAIDSLWLCILCIEHYRKLCTLFLFICDIVLILSEAGHAARDRRVEGPAVAFVVAFQDVDPSKTMGAAHPAVGMWDSKKPLLTRWGF